MTYSKTDFPNFVAPFVSVAVKPHKHDCDKCVFIGQKISFDDTHEDFYYCRKSGSLIRRFGIDGEYGSMPRSLAVKVQAPEFMELERLVQRIDFKLMVDKYRNGTLPTVSDLAVSFEEYETMMELQHEMYACGE